VQREQKNEHNELDAGKSIAIEPAMKPVSPSPIPN
jgi:hypothetical protein